MFHGKMFNIQRISNKRGKKDKKFYWKNVNLAKLIMMTFTFCSACHFAGC